MMAVRAIRDGLPGALAAIAAVALVSLALGVSQAKAETPWWRLSATSAPTNLPPGGKGFVDLALTDLGGVAISGARTPIAISDTLPAGVTATAVSSSRSFSCGAVPTTVVRCTSSGVTQPYEALEVNITVSVGVGAGGSLPNHVAVEGGEGYECAPLRDLTGRFLDSLCRDEGAARGSYELELNGQPVTGISEQHPLTIAAAPVQFGVERYEAIAENSDGTRDTQAGSHPFQLTTTLALNESMGTVGVVQPEPAPATPQQVKALSFSLPPGLIGNTVAVARCSTVDFTVEGRGGANACPPDTVVGVATLTYTEPRLLGYQIASVPVFNLAPAEGEPARFGFTYLRAQAVLDTSVRSGSDYGVDVSVANVPQSVDLISTRVTLWGVPGDPRHDTSRGWGCLNALYDQPCSPLGQPQPLAFLTLPTSCGSPLSSSVQVRSWAPGAQLLEPLQYTPTDSTGRPLAISGCELLGFDPSISLAPDQHSASTPTGLSVGVHVPQESTLSATGLAEADVRNTTVRLPSGLRLSPGAATGLLACSASQVGFEGPEEAAQTQNDAFSPAPAACSEEAKVGTVSIRTPLLANELTGAVYLAAQATNPFEPPLVLYLIAEDPVSGVRVKLAGKVTPDPLTGQLVSTFEHTPQLPFEDLRLHFFDGPRGSLATPDSCGPHTSVAVFEPWSAGAAATSSSTFQTTVGADGGACPSSPPPLAPGFNAETANVQAAAFTPLSTNVTIPDGDQELSAITVHLPAGVAAMLSSVVPCPAAQAATGTCGSESLIGHTTVSAGLGPEPIDLGGSLYLTGPYEGAPFGLAAVTKVDAGPFHFKEPVIVRARIEVDPHTAAVTVASDPLPKLLKGVPTQIKALDVTVDRPGFAFNPTSCAPTAITGTLTGYEGAAAAVSSPFQVTGCRELAFSPRFTASTLARTSKRNGAYLNVHVAASAGQANIAQVHVALPIALPSRLTTLQRACLAAVFEANPASCPPGSVVGSARVVTPVLRSPLAGPAYLVSHGGARFPDLEIVLEAEGVTIILDGSTLIRKGVTSSTFSAVPDAPFSSFDLVLPTGPDSLLTAYGSVCAKPLVMPTRIAGQNGATLTQSTRIAVTGCPKAKSRRGHHRAGRRAGRRR